MHPISVQLTLTQIEDPSTVGKFGRTCKKYYAIMMPLLHKRVAVAAMFHAHISKLIRGLEPYLTIAQKKQLKKEGKYKGQQERFPSHLDANAKPGCGLYVQQMIVGVSSPGKKHDYIVHRYVEEAFKNLSNLQVVEAYFLTRSVMYRHAVCYVFSCPDLLMMLAGRWRRVLLRFAICKRCACF